MKLALLLCFVSLRLMAGEWDAFEWLMGSWAGEGGGFTYSTDLDGKILVRRNVSQARGVNHKDLLIHYSPTRAIYFDNEGHVIQYTVEAAGDKIVLLGEATPGAPRFRFTYTKLGADRLRARFDIAPPGKPEDFQVYLEGTLQRTNSKESPK